MALQKSIENPQNGVVSAYHKVDQVVTDKTKMRIMVSSYKDAAARQAGKTSTTSQMVTLENDLAVQVGAKSILAYAYGLLKAVADFAGATDC